MTRLLEDLQPGTPVFDGEGTRVGEIRAVYASGEARGAEFLLVYWDRRGEEALVPADDVAEMTDAGVVLMSSAATYDELAAFDPAANPALHRL
jgi:uncharacterized protein (DUF433 family)